MKERKQICPWGLIWEGFRQCRILGILCLVVMVLGAAAVPLQQWLGNGTEWQTQNTASIICSYPDSNPLLLVAAPAALLMTWILFHFLDSRASSDFYLALPYRRLTLYLCWNASILLWMGILIVSSMAVSLAVCNLMPHTVVVYDGMLSYVGSVVVLLLLLMAGALVGMGLSGTIFTNILLSGILLFLPRLCCYLLSHAVTSSIPFLVNGEEGQSFFRNSNNLLFVWMCNILDLSDGTMANPMQPGWQTLLYTFLLALVYFAVAAWLFHRRRSETAGQAAPSRMLQHVYRILVTMSVSLVITCSLYIRLVNGSQQNGNWFVYLIAYLAAVLIYGAYELITTRKWKNLWMTLPGLAVVAVLNGGALLGMHAAYHQILADRPSVQEMQSVSFRNGQATHDSEYLFYTDYVDLSTQRIQITDSTVLSLISYYLDENIKTFEESPDVYEEKYQTYSSTVSYDGSSYTYEVSGSQRNQSYRAFVVTIRTEGKVMDRVIYIPEKESQELQEILKKDESYVSAWKTLPDPVEDTLYLSTTQNVELTEEEAEQLFKSYRAELQEADYEELSEAALNLVDVEVYLQYSFWENGRNIFLNCPLLQDIFPKTTALYYKFLYQEQVQSRQVLEQVLSGDLAAYVDVTITGGSANSKTADRSMYTATSLETEQTQDLETLQILQKYLKDAAVSNGSSYAEIWISTIADSESEEWGESYSVVLPVSDSIFQNQTLRNRLNNSYTAEQTDYIENVIVD